MKAMFWIQLCSVALLIVSMLALGFEIFVNDLENLTAMYIWGIIAIVCLHINAAIALYRCWKTGKDTDKKIVIFLTFLIIIFWISKLI